MASTTAPDIDLDSEGVYPLAGDLTVTVTPHARYSYPHADGEWQDSGPRMCITDWWSGGGAVRSRRDAAPRENRLVWTGGDAHRVMHVARAERIYCVESVYDAATAWAILADTARSHLVYDRLIRERRERAATALEKARADFDRLSREARYQGHERLLAEAERVYRWGYVPEADLKTVLSDDDVATVVRRAAEFEGTPLYLAVEHVAERIGVDAATIRSYRHRGLLPVPDMELSDRAGWMWDTIEAWVRSRRGQGWAAGTTADEAGRR
ncbi:Uncharacterised protein [Nocardia farcinica]|uniref:Uncharacterized protein n=1 Tax=Nocardia farcinica TaxID=37329 RepID=A0A449G5G9_NOCFR|nr:hypothetical protein [Nocardia farcinica]VFA96194.1 Uncharacterised protein [Nocardia farcinica]